jgi:hypothetical protein
MKIIDYVQLEIYSNNFGAQSWRELYLGVREQKRLNTTGLHEPREDDIFGWNKLW